MGGGGGGGITCAKIVFYTAALTRGFKRFNEGVKERKLGARARASQVVGDCLLILTLNSYFEITLLPVQELFYCSPHTNC